MLKRYSDPKILDEFLRARVKEIEKKIVIGRTELFPVEVAPAGFMQETPDVSLLRWEKGNRRHTFDSDGHRWWLRKYFKVPQVDKDTLLAVKFSCGEIAEGLLYINGKIYSGIASSGVLGQGSNQPITLPDSLKPGEEIELLIHLYAGSDYGSLQRFGPQQLKKFEILKISGTNQKLYDAFSVALDTACVMDRHSCYSQEIFNHLEKAYLMLDFTDEEKFNKTAVDSLRYLEENVFNGKDLQPVRIGLFGHAHIDVAWLWPLDVTREKSIRTFATQLNLISRFDGWTFQQGQAQIYDFLKKDAPAMYENIKEKAKQNRWETSGAVWVETDTNIPGGEALIRQIMYGRKYFEKEFGLRNSVLWLPDVFGYTGSLPQILKKCGVELFITTKISWNQYTRFPYDTFWWKGIDGTKILTHFITTPCDKIHTYNTTVTPKSIYETWLDYQQKDVNTDLLVPFGYGDGGGGPKEDMLRRLNWLKKGIKGFVKVEDCALEEYNKRLTENVSKCQLPVWEDELYLEYHRGTYTTQARIKENNRKSEFLLREAEMLSLCSANCSELSSRLKRAWELVLLNQFHDILPGSSIKEVYEKSEKQFCEVREICNQVIENALKSVIEGDKTCLTIFNPFSWKFTGYVKIPDAGLAPETIPYQIDNNGVVFRVEELEPMGFMDVKLRSNTSPPPIPLPPLLKGDKGESSFPLLKGALTLQNKFYRIVINGKDGSISSLIHKESNRELSKDNAGLNILEVYQDKAIEPEMSAWNIDYMHQYKCYAKNGVLSEGIESEHGELFRKVKIKKKLLNSIVEQEIVIYEEDPLIYFNTTVDWQEEDCVLKAAFPVDIHANFATYDIQFGNITRPTHRNTLHDHARFEVPAHKWVDLSEGYFGVSLMSNCKYGYSVLGSELRITLLRAPNSPDDTADRGRHNFTYCLYPHSGDWRQADVPKLAYQFNIPVRVVSGQLRQDVEDVLKHGMVRLNEISVDNPDKGTNLIVETIKVSEDGKGIVARLYECKNTRGLVNLKLNFPGAEFRKVYLCDMMENHIEELGTYDKIKGINLKYSPYEIITVKLKSPYSPFTKGGTKGDLEGDNA